MKRDTGLVDDYGNKLYEGDTIEWSYIAMGMRMEDGSLMECVPASHSEPRTKTEVIKYEVSQEFYRAGYFLNPPPRGWTAMDIKCKKINPIIQDEQYDGDCYGDGDCDA